MAVAVACLWEWHLQAAFWGRERQKNHVQLKFGLWGICIVLGISISAIDLFLVFLDLQKMQLELSEINKWRTKIPWTKVRENECVCSN